MAKTRTIETKKSVGIWIRVSTEDQAHGESPEHHEKRARYYAESRDWEVVEVYHLEAVSGKSVMDHAEAKRMLADVRSGRINALVFSKLARLARNTRELLEFADVFRAHEADLVSLQEAIDTSTPAGRLFYTMIAAMAQWEREEITDRINASITIRAKLGKPLSGKASYGYVWKDKKLVVEPTEAPIRRRIYELFMEHRRKRTVARVLNEAGYRTRNGSKFSGTTIVRLIKDPTAKGKHRANYTAKAKHSKKWGIKPESEWVWHKVEPIVSEELWTQCNQLLEEQLQAKTKRPGRKPVHLFAGLTYCHCGKKMYVPSNTPKYLCYTCKNKIPIVDLEAIFYDQLKGFFLSPQEVSKYLKNADQHLAEREALLATRMQEQDKVAREIDRVYRLYQEGGVTSEGFGKFYRPLEERQGQLEDETLRLQAEVDALKINHLSSDQILSEAETLYGQWNDLSRDEKRRIVESLTDTIVVGEGEIAINLCHLPSSEELTKRQRSLWGSWRRRA